MGKKKQTESQPLPVEPVAETTPVPETQPSGAAENGQLGELGREVEAFLAQRQQLAQKLADEIAATEQKLAELKRTAAALFPQENLPPAAAKERRPKSAAAAKPAKRKAAPEAAAEAPPPSSNTSANEAQPPAEPATTAEPAPHEPALD